MPRNAIASAPVDLVLPLAEIPAAALRFARTQPRLEVLEEGKGGTPETRQFLHKLCVQVQARTGRDFTHYKPSTILRRTARRMQFNHIQDPNTYLSLLQRVPEEAHSLADDLLNHRHELLPGPGRLRGARVDGRPAAVR